MLASIVCYCIVNVLLLHGSVKEHGLCWHARQGSSCLWMNCLGEHNSATLYFFPTPCQDCQAAPSRCIHRQSPCMYVGSLEAIAM